MLCGYGLGQCCETIDEFTEETRRTSGSATTRCDASDVWQSDSSPKISPGGTSPTAVSTSQASVASATCFSVKNTGLDRAASCFGLANPSFVHTKRNAPLRQPKTVSDRDMICPQIQGHSYPDYSFQQHAHQTRTNTERSQIRDHILLFGFCRTGSSTLVQFECCSLTCHVGCFCCCMREE